VSGERLRVPLRRVGSISVPLPSYQTAGAVGLDLHAALTDSIHLAPGQRRLIPTGIALAVPVGYEAQVRPRSGLAARSGLGIVNSPGTIDPDFRGEIMVLLINWGSEVAEIAPLSRIAQLVVCPVVRVELEVVTELDPTERGSGGYGSTGAQ
jgi:dUTP pyrophosphatase